LQKGLCQSPLAHSSLLVSRHRRTAAGADQEAAMSKIAPCLWFDHQAEEAANFYAALFKDSRIDRVSYYGKEGFEIHGRPEGSVLTVAFQLAGRDFLALNGGPHFKFTPALSLFVVLESEAEIDALWAGLGEGSSVLMPLDAYDWSPKYGWLSDRYGLSWQVMLGRKADVGQTISPSLLFVGPQHGKAEEAMKFYTSLFSGSVIDGISRYDGEGADPAGSVKHAQFRLNGDSFMAMDSAFAHQFGFTEAVSFMVNCDTQEEIDRFWSALSAVPQAEQCGWLKDRFGVSWQIVPAILPQLLSDPDRQKSGRVMTALLGMRKLDIARLIAAHRGSG
jgi:predicted 3-demethylubiquinone-9 3-methyltransferase (glyoxalase superfamily)